MSEYKFKDYKEIDKEFIKEVLNKPKIIGIVSDVNQGKSMLLYNLIELLKDFDFKLVTYGMRAGVNSKQIYSIEELEDLRDCVIMADEFFSLFDLDDRKKVKIIEKTLRLINHNNNILILAGTGENFKKFISNKLDGIFFKKVSLGDFINGSRVKNICMSYKGYELGASVMNFAIDKALFYNQKDGSYTKYKVKYLKEYDTKLDNVKIVSEKKYSKSVQENVEYPKLIQKKPIKQPIKYPVGVA
jgi:hypothetical protein